jgi:hypothetical protein
MFINEDGSGNFDGSIFYYSLNQTAMRITLNHILGKSHFSENQFTPSFDLMNKI